VRLEIRYGDLDPYGHVNNAVYLAYFEQVRLAYWRALADLAGIEKLEAPVFFEDALHGAATVPWVDNRSYAMHFELRTGEDFQTGTTTCEGSAAHVFFDPLKAAVQHRPGWFLPTVAALEGRPEADFTPPER
jgi:acyl-CoA thioester hydrolase